VGHGLDERRAEIRARAVRLDRGAEDAASVAELQPPPPPERTLTLQEAKPRTAFGDATAGAVSAAVRSSREVTESAIVAVPDRARYRRRAFVALAIGAFGFAGVAIWLGGREGAAPPGHEPPLETASSAPLAAPTPPPTLLLLPSPAPEQPAATGSAAPSASAAPAPTLAIAKPSSVPRASPARPPAPAGTAKPAIPNPSLPASARTAPPNPYKLE
jgi:hypothetical protein